VLDQSIEIRSALHCGIGSPCGPLSVLKNPQRSQVRICRRWGQWRFMLSSVYGTVLGANCLGSVSETRHGIVRGRVDRVGFAFEARKPNGSRDLHIRARSTLPLGVLEIRFHGRLKRGARKTGTSFHASDQTPLRATFLRDSTGSRRLAWRRDRHLARRSDKQAGVSYSASIVSILTWLRADCLGSASYANSVYGFSSNKIGWCAKSPM